MIRLNHRHILTSLCAAATLLSTGCNRQEELIFEGSSNDRVLKTITETDKILRGATNGWQTEYETSRGFKTILQFQFLDDHKVITYADYSETPSESTYKYNMTRGAVITFDTYGLLHEMAAPYLLMDQGKWTGSQQAEMGKGFGGDIEFEIMSATPDSVWLRGIKDSNYKFKLVPLTKAPGFKDQVGTYGQQKARLSQNNGYTFYLIEDGEKTIGEFNLTYRGGDLQSSSFDLPTLTSFLLNEKGEVVEVEHTVHFDDDKYILEPALQINGKEYSTFVRPEEYGPFISTDNANIRLNYDGNAPAFLRAQPNLVPSYWAALEAYNVSPLFKANIADKYKQATNRNFRDFGFQYLTNYKIYSDAPTRITAHNIFFWSSSPSRYSRLFINCVHIEGNKYKIVPIDLQWWETINFIETKDSGWDAFAKYFTTYFSEDTYKGNKK